MYAGSLTTGTVVKQCVNYGMVTANTSGHSYVGGVVGVLQNNGAGTCILDRSVNRGTVYGAGQRVGGVLGYITQAASGGGVTVSNLVNHGSVTSALGRLGGVVGFSETKSVTEGCTPEIFACVNYGTVSGGTGYEIAGLFGYLAGGGNLRDSVNFGTVTAADEQPVSGVLGKTYTGLTTLTHTIENCYTTAYAVIPEAGYEKPDYFVFSDCGVKTEAEIESGETTLPYGEGGLLMRAEGFIPAALVGTLPLGDIDADGETTIRDALLLLQAFLDGKKPMNPWFADINEDGKILLIDVLAVLKISIQ